MSEYLPPEVVTLILSRLPVESAVRCTSVCKAWYALIKHPSFISTHLQSAALHHPLLLLKLCDRYPNPTYYLYRDSEAFEAYKQFWGPSKPEIIGRIAGTCNGLICLVDLYFRRIFLWNPSIKKHFTLPEPDFSHEVSCHTITGFGFDSVSNDHKVFLYVHDTGTGDYVEVWLFSLNRCSWTRLIEVSPRRRLIPVCQTVCVKGALHYGLLPNMILAFDLSTEKFFELCLPKTSDYLFPMSLVKYEESIAVVYCGFLHLHKYEIWAMKEYGVDSSWTKVLHSVDENRKFVLGAKVFRVFEIMKNGKVLLLVEGDHKYSFKIATLDSNCHQQEHQKHTQKQLKYLVESNDWCSSFVGSYVESLMLLDKGGLVMNEAR